MTKEQGTKIDLFSFYERYLHPEGLDEKTFASLREFLKRYCGETGEIWTPFNCRAIPSTAGIANIILLETRGEGIVVPQSFQRQHYWLELRDVADSGRIIIDPTGLEKYPLSFNSDSTIPFFGLAETLLDSYRPSVNAEYANSIYNNGKDL